MVKMKPRQTMKRHCDLGLTSLLLACSLFITIVGCTTPAEEAAVREEQHISALEPFGLPYPSIHRMLRNENEPDSYRGETRYQQKRFIQPRQKRSIVDTTQSVASARVLNATQKGLEGFYNSSSQFKGQFELITIMDLSSNRLNGVHLDSKFTQLRLLDISNNSLRQQPFHLASTAVSSLTTLDLSCNHFSQLSSGSFFAQQLPSLKHLNLAHNQLGNISRETFYNLYELQTLLLSHNNITDIDYETFLALPNLQHLDLSYNRLAGSAIRALQGIPDLVTLSIAHNPQVGAAMQEFVASWSLKELDASATGLCQVPAALAQSVRTLKLSDNWLRTINCGDMDSYPLLQYLDLSHSRIAQVEDDALGRLELLETLFLNDNQLMRVPGSLPTSLEQLFMQNNQIMDLQPQVFAGLVNLQILDLSGNRLLYLPPLRLPKLITLNLQSAGVESVSQSIVHTLPELRDLLLDDNPIKCSDLLGIAEWASPCRSVDMNPPRKEKIDLKQQYMQLYNFYEHFKTQCGRAKEGRQTEDDKDSAPPTCRLLVPTTTKTTETATSDAAAPAAPAAAAAQQTMPKGQKSKTEGTMQSVGYNIAQLTTKTLRPTETTSLAKLQQQQQQMPGIPQLTATAATVEVKTTTTTTSKSLPTLTQTKATERQNILATASSQPTTRLTVPTNVGHVAASTPTAATTISTTTTTAAAFKVPQTISGLIKSSKQATNDDWANKESLLKTVETTETTTTATSNDISDQIAAMAPHKHATLQLHIKDRHLIGTPLLMHKGDNLLVDAEQLLLPGTATVADAAETLEKSQQQQQQQRQPSTDKRQPEAINGDIKSPSPKTKKKPSLTIKKMTYSTKHGTTTTTTTTTTTSAATPTTGVETSTMLNMVTSMSTPQRLQHQHGSVNTPKTAAKQELSTFAQLKAYAELKTESKPEHLLDKRQENEQTLSGSHPGVMLLVACILVIVLLAGLAHVYRCELPWQRRCRPGHAMRPHLQRPLNESDDGHSFLHYQGSSGNHPADPARLQKWHHSTRREAPYSSPLHNLQARELQREQQKLQRCQQFYSASLASSSSSTASGSSRSSLQSPCQEDSYYIEMAPSSPPAAVREISMPSLPMELLASSSGSSSSNSNSRSKMAATDLGGTTAMPAIKAVSSRIMAPSSRRLGIW
ncbi:uncharacterized protein LOC6649631 [Drosophila willistoni]|uniref:uncharacterized protein LOC6649631 n=1 Tax=Drosophila willistoni TaxID=7260 RepID=UPI000C26C4FF|nr:uncharacterized protein LOC6649631 [Drosophila willistoni]XP_046865235.1 uncharacterized protein LOC6649631 [Drosophila willistoni]